MADKTISQANLRETLDGTEQLPVSYGGNPFRVFVSGIKDYIINNFFTNKSVTDQLGDIGGELSYKNALVRGASPAGVAGDVQYNDGAGSLVTYAPWKNNFNTITKTYTEGLYPVAKLLGEKATSNSRFSNDGDSEKRLIQLRLAVNDATPSNMFIGTSSTAGVILPAQISGWAFKVKVVGVKDDGSSAAFFFEGCIQRKSDTTVSFAGTPLKTSYIDASLTGVDAAVIANDTDKRLDIQVTGLAATNIRWTAVVDVAQSVWGAW